MFGSRNIASQSTPGDPNETPGIRYLYWGLTGARFGRSAKTASKNDDIQQQDDPAPVAWAQWDDTPEVPANPKETEEPHRRDRTGVRVEETIARLTAERDAARYECELAADYREALARTVEMLRGQFEEAQRRLTTLTPDAASVQEGVPTPREVQLESQLVEALRRINELEASAAAKATETPPALRPPGAVASQDDMMDIFLQFVGSRDRPDSTRL